MTSPQPSLELTKNSPDATLSLVLNQPVMCADHLARCPWSVTNALLLEDHDVRWGQPPQSTMGWFEALTLEIFQAGLAPGTALGRHDSLAKALCGFRPADIALLNDDDIDDLMVERTMIRNRAKLVAVVGAARLTETWSTNDWNTLVTDAAAHGDHAARELATQLRALGITHIGENIARHILARTGAINAHVPGCYRGDLP